MWTLTGGTCYVSFTIGSFIVAVLLLTVGILIGGFATRSHYEDLRDDLADDLYEHERNEK